MKPARQQHTGREFPNYRTNSSSSPPRLNQSNERNDRGHAHCRNFNSNANNRGQSNSRVFNSYENDRNNSRNFNSNTNDRGQNNSNARNPNQSRNSYQGEATNCKRGQLN